MNLSQPFFVLWGAIFFGLVGLVLLALVYAVRQVLVKERR